MNHFLDWIKVGVIEISQEPQDTRSQYFSEEDYKGSKVENINHPNEPVDEDTCPGRSLEGLNPVLDGGVKQREAANVEPDPAHDGKHEDFRNKEQSNFDDNITQSQSSGCLPKPENLGAWVYISKDSKEG